MSEKLSDIGMYLAVQALKEYYRPTGQIAELKAIETFCYSEASLNLYRTYLRLQRQHIDRIVVGMVLETLDKDTQKFVKYHYRDNMKYYLITQKVPFSMTALARINKRILSDIYVLMFYSLSTENLFYCTKVINMIYILDLRIMALSRENLTVKKAWLRNLIKKRKKYRNLLNIMQSCMDVPEKEQEIPIHEGKSLGALRNAVVAAKLQHPTYNINEIAQLSGTSTPTVSRKLRQYITAASACLY